MFTLDLVNTLKGKEGKERKKNILSYNNSYFYHSFILITLHLRKNQKGIDGKWKAFNFKGKFISNLLFVRYRKAIRGEFS